MRIWTIHPQYLDAKGLVALWREGLLAQKVLLGQTTGYRNHPQLIRFKASCNPVGALANYLGLVWLEGVARGYNFDQTKIASERTDILPIKVSVGQVEYEWRHFLQKIFTRDPVRFHELSELKPIMVHPSFAVTAGGIEPWERIQEPSRDKGVLQTIDGLDQVQ